MLFVFYSLKDLDFDQLMQVYRESNQVNGRSNYRDLDETRQLLYAEQDFYVYLRDVFFNGTSFYAVLMHNGRYVSALRLEEYKDGLLLEALETAQSYRGQGFATLLLQNTLDYISAKGKCKIYAHVHKRNRISMAVHTACHFTTVLDHAVFIDGSVSWDTLTLCCDL